MITEREVRQAIDECLREPVTGQKRAVLADLIIINGYLFGQHPQEGEPDNMISRASHDPEQTEDIIYTNGGSEFLDVADGRKAERFWKLMNEFVEAVKILHPRMYSTFIDKIQDL